MNFASKPGPRGVASRASASLTVGGSLRCSIMIACPSAMEQVTEAVRRMDRIGLNCRYFNNLHLRVWQDYHTPCLFRASAPYNMPKQSPGAPPPAGAAE